MNKVILMGRMTRDPEVRYTAGEDSKAYARFTLAVGRLVARNAQEGGATADFISCCAFGKRAEFLEKYGRQGLKLVLEGRIQTGSYTNQEGSKVYTTDVMVENLEFAESKASSEGSGSGGYTAAPHQRQARPQPAPADADGFMNIPDGIDEELPFN